MGVILTEASGDNAGHEVFGGNSKLVAFEILSVLLQLLSIVFNGAIICTLCRRSLLKYPSNRFVFSLCLSHLLVSFISVSISVVTTFLPFPEASQMVSGNKQHHENHVGHTSADQIGGIRNTPLLEEAGKFSIPVQCTGNHDGVDLAHIIMMHLNFGVAVCTSITVAIISVERYITIARPMRYKSIVTARRSLYAIICCWLLAALITLMPLLLFENRNLLCGTFSLPMESLATYFGIVFAVVTVFALAVMIVCYTHIFRIAKAKCQKVQIGHFTASTVSSISSDWPSSVYSSVQGQHRFLHAGSRIESSNSLLHWVLLSNLGRHNQPLRVPNALRAGTPLTPPATPTLPPKNAFFSESALNSRRESEETATTGTTSGSRNGSASSSSSNGGNAGNTSPSSYFIDQSRSPLFQYHHLPPRKLRNRWKTYLQPNYNSPRKTIFTIMLLIGAVLFTQLPLSFVLFTSTVETTQRWFQFCISVLFSTSSVANPVLYGFLNRSIRNQLWRLLRRKSYVDHGPSASSFRKRKRGQQQQLEEMAQTSKGILSSASQRHLQNLYRSGGGKPTALEIPAIKISRKESISSDDNSIANSVASTNSINVIGRANTECSGGAKDRLSQVQKRITSSPYYRTVLLKKASIGARKNSLLPRLALPDVNVRRNSSGSIISIRTNGVMSMIKGKVKELDEELSSSCSIKHDDTDATNQHPIEVHVEMQTFRNYSTPDLQSTLQDTTQLKNADDACQESEIYADNGNADSIQMSSENKSEGQGQLTQHDNDENDVHNNSQSIVGESTKESCSTSENKTVTSACMPPQMLDEQPGSSQAIVCSESANENQSEKLEACLSAESLMGVLIDGELLPENFPRKPSQDSGADMTFSDEEEELTPSPAVNEAPQKLSPILLSAASLASLPATLTVMLRTGEDIENVTDDKRLTTSRSAQSLMGPILFVEHPDVTGNLNNSQSILYLPCSCGSKGKVDNNVADDNKIDEHDSAKTKKENGITVTITESNSDTQLQLYNPHPGYSSKRLLQVENWHYHCHSPEWKKSHKSKSDSEICTINQRKNSGSDENGTDLKVRSNCHLDYVVISDKPYSLSNSGYKIEKNDNLTNAFTLLSSCSSNHIHVHEKDVSPCGSVWLANGQLPLLKNCTSSSSSDSNLNQSHLISSSHSPQWLSVMSVHSSCSSLSSTCPLRILEENNKSDISDYDDFEDHIEI